MAKTSAKVTMIPLGELLAALPPHELLKEKLAQQLEEIAIEEHLLSLVDLSLERETQVIGEIVARLKNP